MENKTVLVVEDSVSLVEMLKDNLENAGYCVKYAMTGLKAMELLEADRPDIILLDIMLPDMNGYEICHKLKESGTDIITPVLVLSAKDRPMDKILGLKLGADDYMTKPFEIEELLLRMENLLRRTKHALSANPLTHLPGNESIMHEVYTRIKSGGQFAFVYIDIDNFKAFNDRYGFKKGDDVIKFAAKVIRNNIKEKDFVGHVGGDDFIVICVPDDAELKCVTVIREFEAGVGEFYDEKARSLGHIYTTDRRGDQQKFGLMTLSVGMVTNDSPEMNHYGRIIEVAAEMKKFAKMKRPGEKSTLRRDQRK